MRIEDLRSETVAAVVIADGYGFVTLVNERFEDIFGWSREEIVGKPVTTIIPPNLHDAHHLGFSRFLTTGEPTLLNQPVVLRAVTKDGREFDAEHVILAERDKGDWIFGAKIRPL